MKRDKTIFTIVRSLFFRSLLLIFLSTLPAAHAENIRCRVCSKEISGKYIQVDGKNYCSRTCYNKTVPRCARCGQPVHGNYLKAGDQVYCSKNCFNQTLPVCEVCHQRIEGAHSVLEGKHFCSKRCMDAHMPKCERCGKPLYSSIIIGEHQYCRECGEKPSCWKCRLPKPLIHEFADGRKLCRECTIGMIATGQQGAPLYVIAQHEVKRVTAFRSPSLPNLQLVGQDTLKKYAPAHMGLDSVQWGIYHREVTVTTTRSIFRKPSREVTEVKEAIFILTGLDRREFISTAAHELTHDLLAEEFPELAKRAPIWVEEGLCQYVAAGVCLLNGWFDELKAIENAPDVNYGGGYRYFKRKFGDADWNSVVQWIKRTDFSALPAVPPGE